jgi:Non-repetitive/WGA-negative nucleoporin C-terminal
MTNYMSKGQLRNLLEPQARFVPLLEAFLRTNDYPRIQWIHDLAVSRHDAAATSLEEESRTETKLATKHVKQTLFFLVLVLISHQVILSISKLCTLAQHVDMDSEPVLNAIQGNQHCNYDNA